ncbi:MAG: LCP family protein [Armatimonadetes bacterium]|nr:LCP family protein [Armatimonadota bacterium]
MAQQAGPQPEPRRRSQSPAEKLIKLLAVMLVTFVAVAGTTVAVFGLMNRKPGESFAKTIRNNALDVMAPAGLMFDRGPRANILLVGEDVPINQYQQITKEDSRSDTNMLISLDQNTKQVYVLSLPRDLRVTIPGLKGTGHKLNAAHRNGGVPKLIETIEANLGIRVHHYVKTNAHGFIEMVDKVGGVDVDVERDMNYDDNWQDFHVHLKKGPQHLTGIQAQGYVRWRKNNNGVSDPMGDLGRVQRQQKCMRQLAAKILQPGNLVKFPAVLQAVRGYVQTDLSDRQLMALMAFLKDVNSQTITTDTLPCDYHSPFMYVRKPEAVAMLTTALGVTFDQGPILNAFDPRTAPVAMTAHSAKREADEDAKSKLGKSNANGNGNGKAREHEVIEPDPGDDDTHAPPPPRPHHTEPQPGQVKIIGDPKSGERAKSGDTKAPDTAGKSRDGGTPKSPDKPKAPEKPKNEAGKPE